MAAYCVLFLIWAHGYAKCSARPLHGMQLCPSRRIEELARRPGCVGADSAARGSLESVCEAEGWGWTGLMRCDAERRVQSAERRA